MIKEKWFGYSLNEQLGNILSEISRANNRHKAGEVQSEKASLNRAMTLIDLTLADEKHACNMKEIKMLRDIVADKLASGNYYAVSYEDIQNYLLPFAVLVRS